MKVDSFLCTEFFVFDSLMACLLEDPGRKVHAKILSSVFFPNGDQVLEFSCD